MPNYAPAEDEHLNLLHRVSAESPELEVFHETKPVIHMVVTAYEEGAFDTALRKKLGANPVMIRKVGPLDHHVMLQISGEDGAEPPDFIMHIDPAALKPFPEEARRAFVFNALAQIVCEKVENEETQSWEYKKASDGRFAFKVRPAIAIASETLARFGAFNAVSDLIVKASKGAQMEMVWTPQAPAEPEEPAPITPGPGSPELQTTDGTPEGGGVEQTEPGSEPEPASSAASG